MNDALSSNRHPSHTTSAPKTEDWLTGGGEMGKLIRSMDWSKTPLGPIESWPQSLRTTVSLCLASNSPIALIWGPSHIQIYNDGYWPICGSHHPRSMGQNFRECWTSAWPVVGEAFTRALTGETSYLENQRMFLERNGYLEEASFTFSFSPIQDENGDVGGLFHPVTETTSRMLSERRTRALLDLTARTGNARTSKEVFTLAADILTDHDLDLPFVMIYSVDGDGKIARLVAGSGLMAGTAASPEKIELAGSKLWALDRVVSSGMAVQVENLEKEFGPIKCGSYPESPKMALALPIIPHGAKRPTAILIAGISPRLPFNEVYRGFCEQVASVLTAALANAQVYEDQLFEAVRDSEERFRTLANAIPQLCWMANADGWISWYNQRWYKYTGTTPEQMEGWGWQSVHDPEVLPKVLEQWKASIATGRPFDMVFPLRGSDGIFRTFLSRSLPEFDQAGKVVRWFGTNTDVSERERAKEELHQAKEVAETANRVKSQFLANMSHELRTPMTGVLGMLDLAIEGPLESEQRDFIETARISALSLVRILNDILDLTKIEAGKLSVEKKPFSIRKCIENIFNIFIPVAMNKGLDFYFTVAEDVPEILIGDQSRLSQILTNLAGNAIKFTEKGEITIRVAVGGTAYEGKREVTFIVADTGIGIPDDKKDLLFRIFSQVDESHTRRYGGTGLGLAICKEIVILMGGTISFMSEEGKESTFTCTIPFGEVISGHEAAPIKTASEEDESGAKKITKPRLLIAEDDPIIRQVLGSMFRRTNFEIEFAENGQKAVEMWENGKFDLIVMDVQMPRMNGLEATSAIREKEKTCGGHTPIVAMTAYADKEKCLAAGMDAYVSKPIDFKKTLHLIGETIKMRR